MAGQRMPQQMPGQRMPQPMPSQRMPYQPMPGQQMPYQPMPGQQMPYQPMPGQQMPYQPMPGQQMPYQPMPGQQMPQPMSGQQMPQPMPGQMQNQPMPGQQVPYQPMAGQRMPQPMPGQQMPYQPMPGQRMPQPMPGQQMPYQPMTGQQMPMYQIAAFSPGYNGPPGLEYLSMVDQLIIKQEAHILEFLTGWECKNKYRVLNSMGQLCYNAFEESDVCCRLLCGQGRAFTMHLTDSTGMEIMTMERSFKLCVRLFNCCACVKLCQDEIEIKGMDGSFLGKARADYSLCIPYYIISDDTGEDIFEVRGPFCPCSCGNDVIFSITEIGTETEIGKIRKHWSGVLREMYTDADNFGVEFRVNLDVKVKAVILGLVFLIDFVYFETATEQQGGGGMGGIATLAAADYLTGDIFL